MQNIKDKISNKCNHKFTTKLRKLTYDDNKNIAFQMHDIIRDNITVNGFREFNFMKNFIFYRICFIN
jgi:hypothetical protein